MLKNKSKHMTCGQLVAPHQLGEGGGIPSRLGAGSEHKRVAVGLGISPGSFKPMLLL